MTELIQHNLQPIVITETNGAYQLQPNVILVLQDGVSRLLGLNRGQFYGLDEIGTRILMLLLEKDSESAALEIAAEYNVSPAQVQTDVNQLLQQLQAKQLICRPSTQQLTPPSLFTVLLLLTLAWISVRTIGWTKTIQLGRRSQTTNSGFTTNDQARSIVEAVDLVVRQAAAKHALLPMACKERALVGWYLLRNRFALPAELVIGIEFYPFEAHAWVECGDWVITDEQLHCEMFTPAVRYR